MRSLVIDIGNSYIKLVLFEQDKILKKFKFATCKDITKQQFESYISDWFKNEKVNKIVLGSVVPDITHIIKEALVQNFGHVPVLDVSVKTNTGILIKPENKTIGVDRIADAVGASELYGTPAIVIDLGTATVFTVINCNNEIEGGLILPGSEIALNALLKRAVHLPKIQFEKPHYIIGENTLENMKAGIYWSTIAQVEGITEMIKKELDREDIKVIVTGGLSNVIKDYTFKNIQYLDSDLTCKGLKIIGERNL